MKNDVDRAMKPESLPGAGDRPAKTVEELERAAEPFIKAYEARIANHDWGEDEPVNDDQWAELVYTLKAHIAAFRAPTDPIQDIEVELECERALKESWQQKYEAQQAQQPSREMRTEKEIREMLAILRAFNLGNGDHGGMVALRWVLGEYPADLSSIPAADKESSLADLPSQEPRPDPMRERE